VDKNKALKTRIVNMFLYITRLYDYASSHFACHTNDEFSSMLFFRNEFKQRFGVSVSFLATHSGLLRWHDYNTVGEEISPE
jgi:hypothetical protein